MNSLAHLLPSLLLKILYTLYYILYTLLYSFSFMDALFCTIKSAVGAHTLHYFYLWHSRMSLVPWDGFYLSVELLPMYCFPDIDEFFSRFLAHWIFPFHFFWTFFFCQAFLLSNIVWNSVASLLLVFFPDFLWPWDMCIWRDRFFFRVLLYWFHQVRNPLTIQFIQILRVDYLVMHRQVQRGVPEWARFLSGQMNTWNICLRQ